MTVAVMFGASFLALAMLTVLALAGAGAALVWLKLAFTVAQLIGLILVLSIVAWLLAPATYHGIL